MFILIILVLGGTYIAHTLNLLGPMMQMSNAAMTQGVDIAKQQLRDFIANSDTARQALSIPARDGDSVGMDKLDSRGKKVDGGEDDIEDI